MGFGVGVDFHVNFRPYSIDFRCPYCMSHAEILWEDLDVPAYWSEEWGAYECPDCGEWVLLGDCHYE